MDHMFEQNGASGEPRRNPKSNSKLRNPNPRDSQNRVEAFKSFQYTTNLLQIVKALHLREKEQLIKEIEVSSNIWLLEITKRAAIDARAERTGRN